MLKEMRRPQGHFLAPTKLLSTDEGKAETD